MENVTVTNKEIPIFFAVDDGYCPFLAVAIQSLIDNCSEEYKYLIKVLHTNISDENKKRITKYERTNVDIEMLKGKIDVYFSQVNVQRKVITFFTILVILVITRNIEGATAMNYVVLDSQGFCIS